MDLTYIWDDEPVSPGSCRVFNTFPHPGLRKLVVETLIQSGFNPRGESISLNTGDSTIIHDPNGYKTLADWHIVTECDNEPLDGIHRIEQALKFARVFNESYRLIMWRKSTKYPKHWWHFMLTNDPELLKRFQ